MATLSAASSASSLSATSDSQYLFAASSFSGVTLQAGGFQSDTLTGYGSNDYFYGNSLSGSVGSYLVTSLSTVSLSSAKISGIANLIDTSTLPGSLFGSSLLAGTILGAATGAGDTLNDNGLSSIVGGDTLIDTVSSGKSVFIVTNARDSIVGNSLSGSLGSLIQTTLSSFNLGSSLVSGVYNLTDPFSSTSTLTAVLTGSSLGAGTITGGTGADSISDGGVTGTLGDTLIGGGGKDTFVVSNAKDSISGSSTSLIQTTLSSFNLGSSLVSGVYNLTDTFSSASTLTAVLTGSSLGAGTLTGGTGADIISDGGVTGTLGDTLVGGGGADTFVVSNAKDSISGSSTALIQTTLSSFNLGSSLVSGLYNLTDTLPGGAILTGSSLGAGILRGGAGADSISDGGVTSTLGDTLVGGGGKDTFVVSNINDSISGSSTSLIQTTLSNFNFNTSSFHSNVYNLTDTFSSTSTLTAVLTGSSLGAGTLTGGTGADSISDGGVTGTLGDTLIGGGGADIFVVTNLYDSISASSGSSSAVIQTTLASFNFNTTGFHSNVYNLSYIGTTTGAFLEGSSLVGGALKGSAAAAMTLQGDAASGVTLNDGGVVGSYGDTLIANNNPVTFIVSNFNDLISLAGGNSSIISNVSYDLGPSNIRDGDIYQLVYTGIGDATLKGNNKVDTIDASSTSGNVTILSEGSGSYIAGGKGNNTLYGCNDSLGSVTLDASGGLTTTFIVNSSNDSILGGINGNDVIKTSINNFDLNSTLISSVYNLTYTGISTLPVTFIGNSATQSTLDGSSSSAGVTISGAGQKTTLIGGSGNDSLKAVLITKNSDSLRGDSLFGGEGKDTLYSAGIGYNTLNGANGTDTFYVSANTDTIIGNSLSGSLGSLIQTTFNNFNLGSSRVSGVANLIYNGSILATLTGSSLSGSIIGNALATSSETLSDGGSGLAVSTLQGGGGINVYLVSNAQDLIIDYNAYTEIYSGGAANLSGNSLGNLIDASAAKGAVKLWGGRGGSDTLMGGDYNDTLYAVDYNAGNTLEGGVGTNTYYVYANNWDRIIDSGIGSVVHTTASFNLATNATGVSNLVHDGTGTAVVLTGNSDAGSLVGSSTNDTFVGGGNDTMIGGAGNNVYKVSYTTDTIIDYGRNSWIYSSVDYDLSSSLAGGVNNIGHYAGPAVSLSGNANANSISGYGDGDTLIGGGNDTLIGGGSGNVAYAVDSCTNRIVGSYGRGTIYCSASYNLSSSLAGGVSKLIHSGAAPASLIGSTLSNLIVGGAQGADTLSDGGGGVDTLLGSGGNNYYLIASQYDRIQESGSGSSINTTLGSYNLANSLISGVNNIVYIGRANAFLQGNSAADSITGGSGNDTLVDTLSGSNTLMGGGGTNKYIVNNATDLIIDSGTGSVIQSSVDFDLGSSLISGVNNLVYTGSLGALLLGNSSADSIAGASGNDTLVDTLSGRHTLSGGRGTNRYIVNNATDRIIDTGSGSVIQSSVGLSLGSSLVSGVNNLVYTGSGNTTLFGNSNANILDASAASSGVSLSGGAGKDTLLGGSGNDTLIGNGSSSLVGGAGANTFIVSSVADSISDSGSGGVIRSSVGFNLSSSLVSGVNNLVYTGTGNVSLVGTTSANSITGSSGKDTIQGWAGTAASNTASDTLTGGSGADSFILSAAGQTNNAYGNGSGAVAKITDFQGGSTGDKLVLHNFGTGHAGSSGYQTISGGSGVLDVYSYLGADPSHLVAHVTVASGTFTWASNASFV